MMSNVFYTNSFGERKRIEFQIHISVHTALT
jgi:hypothetical protein